MDIFFQILVNVIIPVFFLIGVGAILHRIFNFDINTLSKLNMYLFLPTLCFVNIYENKIEGDTLLYIFIFLVLQSGVLMILSAWISKIAKFDSGTTSVFKNSVVLINSGNFGIPVSQLVFSHNPLGASIQITVMIFQNLLTYTYGLFNSISADSNNRLKAIVEFLKNPVIYAFILGLGLHALNVKIPGFIWVPINNISDAFLAVALITLGVQSAFIKINRFPLPLILSLFGRLILAPAIALLIIFVLNLEGTTAQALFIASSFPTSRNSALLALEYKNSPEYAAQTVLMSTIFSMITVSIVVYLSTILF
ncbi:AEC family transporter [Ornithinibacillus halotolerans]|uniref:Transporter n=1 Tax=Ornithinibacillus halotolerans TaxID=1274357 RepID=A0A916SB08_9BACI|nr:AEC family transporter [Ornithinibacillus halotolerans]GGA91290.1 transporter [Ornithinibacillus halotolerans]